MSEKKRSRKRKVSIRVNVSRELSYDNLSNNAIKEKIDIGELKLIDFKGKSRIWDIFHKVQDEHETILPSIVACKICKNIYKCKKSSTSNLLKHKCYSLQRFRTDFMDAPIEAFENDKTKSARLFTKWTLQNCRPFQIVEDSGLEEVLQFFVLVGAKYGQGVNLKSLLPHRTTLSRNISEIYDVYSNKLKTDLNLIKDSGFALTSDLWTDNYIRKTYIAVTLHYILNGSMACHLLGFKCMENERSTGANIELKVFQILDEFNCRPSGELNIVTDRGTNMISAFKKENRINSVAHLLHNSVKKAMNSVDEIEELCNACTKLVKFFKTHGINSSLKTTLKSFSSTRWNSKYYLLLSVEKNWPEVIEILQAKGEFGRTSNVNVAHLRAVLKILEPFEETFKNLEGEKSPTIHLVHLYINRLKKKLAADVNDSDVITKFKRSLYMQLETTVLNNLSIFHRIALFLFPPANKLVQFTEDEKLETKEKCKNLMRSFREDVLSDVPAQTDSLLKPIYSELLSDYLIKAERNPTDIITKELYEYENENVIFYDDFDVLQWWNINRKRFPLLYRVSCRILAIPSSSTASERAFSTGRQLISEKRSILSGNEHLVGKIMFLHSNMDEQFLNQI